jgi:putative oxidoreductase
MKTKIDLVLQALLGLALVIFGANKFLSFMPAPELPEEAGAFFGALFATGYMIPLIGLTELAAGVLLLARLWSALALVLLAPVSVNIVLFHLVLAPGGILPGLVIAGLNVYLMFTHLPKYRPLLAMK